MARKRKPKQKKDRRQAQSRAPGPYYVQHPLSALPLSERRQALAAVGAEQKERFQVLEPRVRELSEKLDPFYTLSSLVHFALMRTPERIGEDEFLRGGNPLYQSHIEYLQAHMLRHPLTDRHQDPETITELIDATPRLFSAFQQMRLGSAAAQDPAEIAARRGLIPLQELLRGHTLAVRNWAYYRSAIRVSRGMYESCDELARQSLGFKLTHLLDLAEYMDSEITRRVNEFRKRLAALADATTVDGLVDRICSTFTITESPDELRHIFAAADGSLEQARRMAANGLQQHLAEAFFFDSAEIAHALECEPECALLLLNLLSLAPGDLADMDPTTFLLDNPVWLQPSIAVGDGLFFCAIPQSILCFINPIIDRLAQSKPELRQKIKDGRARYLEEQVGQLFSRAFPGATVVRGYEWTAGDRRYESDLIVRFDTTLILVEAKSGTISWPALRGAPDRLKKHVGELIVQPSLQSSRLEKHLREVIETGRNHASVAIDLAGVDHILRISVTLEDFATVQSNLHMLKEAFGNEIGDLAPCILLTDLEAVFDMLEQPFERIDYLCRRAEIQRRFHNQGDELDLLGFYLDTGFNLDEEHSSNLIVLLGFGERFDRYYCGMDAGLDLEKPKARRTAWLQRICERLQGRSPQGWTNIAATLLRLNIEQQEDIERRIRLAADRLRGGNPFEQQRDLLVCTPAPPNSYSMVFLVHDRASRDFRNKLLETGAGQALANAHVCHCAALAILAADPDLNYESAQFFRPAV